MISWPQDMVVQKQLLIQEVPNSDWQKAGDHLMSWVSLPASSTGAITDGSLVFAPTCMGGPHWLLSVASLCGWCCRIWDSLTPLRPFIKHEFPPKKGSGRVPPRCTEIWSEVVNFAQLDHTNICDRVWGASVAGGIWHCSCVGQNQDLGPEGIIGAFPEGQEDGTRHWQSRAHKHLLSQSVIRCHCHPDLLPVLKDY